MRKELPAVVWYDDVFDSSLVQKHLRLQGVRFTFLLCDPSFHVRIVEPEGLSSGTRSLKRIKNPFGSLFAPLIYLVEQARIAWWWVRFLGRHRVKVLFSSSGNSFVIALARQAGWVERFLWMAGDWHADSGLKRTIWSGLASNWLHPRVDRFHVKRADVTFGLSPMIKEKRDRFWGRTYGNVVDYLPPLFPRGPISAKEGKGLLFLGNVREDSGLDPLIARLEDWNREHGWYLVLVGPDGPRRRSLYESTRVLRERGIVRFRPAVEGSALPEATADCFASVNLIDRPGSYTSFTLPGKVFDSWMLGLPMVVTEMLGPKVAEWIREYGVGRVVGGPSGIGDALKDLDSSRERTKTSLEGLFLRWKGTDVSRYFVA